MFKIKEELLYSQNIDICDNAEYSNCAEVKHNISDTKNNTPDTNNTEAKENISKDKENNSNIFRELPKKNLVFHENLEYPLGNLLQNKLKIYNLLHENQKLKWELEWEKKFGGYKYLQYIRKQPSIKMVIPVSRATYVSKHTG
jgi:hypothetical protein